MPAPSVHGNRLVAWLGVLLIAVLVLWPASGHAHPFAASHFDASTDVDAVELSFRFDALAVTELLAAHAPELEPAEMESLAADAQRAYLLGYLDQKFEIKTAGQPCTRAEPTRFAYASKIDKLVVDVRYECGAELEVVGLRSALFVDEETPHQLIGTFRHIRAMERYFFTGGERQATIELDRLRQRAGRPSAATAGGVQIARPPPGAFSGPGRKAAPPKRTTGIAPAGPSAAEANPVPEAQPIASADRAGFVAFLGQGLIHIFGGFDHILFVLTLVLVIKDWKELGLVITSFTVAHSITLAAVALDLIIVSPRLVEPAIAATIVFVALENVFRKQPEARPGLTFGFGLIHGLGFGGALSELGLAGGELAGPLLGFNVGVELGQLAIVLPIFPLVLWARKHDNAYQRLRIGAGIGVALLASWWFIDRLIG